MSELEASPKAAPKITTKDRFMSFFTASSQTLSDKLDHLLRIRQSHSE